jgi:hypothetical protein
MGATGLVLLRGRCRGSRAGTGAWFQMLARDAGRHGVRDAMRAGIECRCGAPSIRTLPLEQVADPGNLTSPGE